MQQIIINGEIIFTKADLYQPFINSLALPAWQGQNLDALWDTMSVWSEPVQISVQNEGMLLAVLGTTGQAFLDLLDELAKENPQITLVKN